MRRTGFVGVAVAVLVSSAASLRAQGTVIGGKTLPQWVAEVKDRDPAVAQNAIQAVVRFGPAAREKAAPAIISRLDDGDTAVRVNAAVALETVGLTPKDLPAGVAGLLRQLADTQAVVRLHAAHALGRLGPDAHPAVPGLLHAARDRSSWEIRRAAVFALGTTAADRQGPPDPRAVQALTEALGDGCSEVRLEAVHALINLGRPVAGADRELLGQALAGVVNDRDPAVAAWARVGLMRVDRVREGQLGALSGLLASRDLRARTEAARALGALGPDARDHIPELIGLLEDRQAEAAQAATAALAQMTGALTEAHLAQMARLLESPEVRVRCQAAAALGALGPPARSRVPDLMAALNDREPEAAAAAAQALGAMGEEARRATPALIQVAEHSDGLVRVAACQALDRITHKEAKPWDEAQGKETPTRKAGSAGGR